MDKWKRKGLCVSVHVRLYVTYLIYVSPSILFFSPIMHLSNTEWDKSSFNGAENSFSV